MTRYVIGLQAEAQAEAVMEAVKEAGATQVEAVPPGVVTAHLPDDMDPEEAVLALAGLDGVAYAEPVVLRQAFEPDIEAE